MLQYLRQRLNTLDCNKKCRKKTTCELLLYIERQLRDKLGQRKRAAGTLGHCISGAASAPS